MSKIYNLAMALFGFLLKVASLFSTKVAMMVRGHRDSKTLIKQIIHSRRQMGCDDTSCRVTTYWVHCASLGEFEQGRPVIEAIRARDPQSKVLLTFFSPSGYVPRRKYDVADWVIYLPVDTPGNAKALIEAFSPDVAVFVKYEFWANYLKYLHKAGVKCYIVSAIFRDDMPFFKFYGGFFRKMLGCFSHFFVQNDHSRELLGGIGIDQSKITVCGDTRFDRVATIVQNAPELPLIEKFAESGDKAKIMVCGSVWPSDTALLLPLIERMKDWRFILAPHEINQQYISELVASLPPGQVVRYTRLTWQQPMENVRVLVVDCVGILSGVYRFGNIAYIGGGFGVGIHNVLEAAAWGQPVIFGPNYAKFKEAVELIKLRSAFSVKDIEELTIVMGSLTSKAEELEKTTAIARNYVFRNTGATPIIIDYICKK